MPAQFVDALFANAGVTPLATDRTAAINEFNGARNTTNLPARARALRRVAENLAFKQQELNRAFVLMEYFGYLRRTPQFVQRSRFTTAFPTTLTPAQFVDALFAIADVIPSTLERSSIINEFGGAGTTVDTAARGRALRRVAENQTLNNNEKNGAFVLMQYFGYLRRNPNDPQDTDYTGYDFWLTKLNEHNGNYIEAEMVKAFLDSTEYRARFGP